MNNPVGVKILKSINDLHRVALDLELMKSLPPLEQLIHALILAELQQDVNTIAILEKMHKLSHIGMLDRSVNLDLTHQLLLRPAPLERRLLDDLGSRYLLSVTLDEFIALGKSTFPEELALDILAIANLSILVLNSLLNDLGARRPWLLAG